jgi:hypothetical protein
MAVAVTIGSEEPLGVEMEWLLSPSHSVSDSPRLSRTWHTNISLPSGPAVLGYDRSDRSYSGDGICGCG